MTLFKLEISQWIKTSRRNASMKEKDSLKKENCGPLSVFIIYCVDSEKIIIPKTPWKWKWKLDLDTRCNIGAIFMDLFKVFGTLNHELLLGKWKPMDFLRMLSPISKNQNKQQIQYLEKYL